MLLRDFRWFPLLLRSEDGSRSTVHTDKIPPNDRVANAGIAQVKSLLDLTPDDFERMFRINVFGVHNCHSTAAKQLISQGNCTMENPGKKKKGKIKKK